MHEVSSLHILSRPSSTLTPSRAEFARQNPVGFDSTAHLWENRRVTPRSPSRVFGHRLDTLEFELLFASLRGGSRKRSPCPRTNTRARAAATNGKRFRKSLSLRSRC